MENHTDVIINARTQNTQLDDISFKKSFGADLASGITGCISLNKATAASETVWTKIVFHRGFYYLLESGDLFV